MEQQVVVFSDGSMIRLTRNPDGTLEVERDGALIGRVQCWENPQQDD